MFSLQVNHLGTALLALLLTPTMVRTGQDNGTNSRLVVVSSGVHHWTTLDKESLDSSSILQKLSDEAYCTPARMNRRYPDSKRTDLLSSISPLKIAAESIPITVLNVLFVRALAERLPRGIPIIPTAVTPGYCYSELRRNMKSLSARLTFAIWDLFLAHTQEQGAYESIWAALGPDGKSGILGHYMSGAYVSTSCVKEPSDFVISKEGKEVQDRIWVRGSQAINF